MSAAAPSFTNFLALALSATLVAGQVTGTYPAIPLASKGPFAYPSGIPYKVDTDVGLIRGTQLGYNICNSTTEGSSSLCQTSFINGLDDFCLWAPSEPGHTVGDIEGEMIAWCTKPGHGTRLIPAAALSGVQYMKTPDYVQVVGFMDQTKINMKEGDFGGEMDPHGADLRGNPMGGILFSNQFTGSYLQAIEWHNFIGSNTFCLKACDPRGPNARHFCEHIYDRIGCSFNAPNAARDKVFESCEGENQDFPGVYTKDGQVVTYTQPPESLGAITTMPYVARVPASSNCRQFDSASIFTGLPSASASAASPTPSTTGSGTSTGSGSVQPSGGSTTRSGASAQSTSGAARNGALVGVAAMGVVFSVVFLS